MMMLKMVSCSSFLDGEHHAGASLFGRGEPRYGGESKDVSEVGFRRRRLHRRALGFRRFRGQDRGRVTRAMDDGRGRMKRTSDE